MTHLIFEILTIALQALLNALHNSGGIFNYDQLCEQAEQLTQQQSDPDIWSDQEKAQQIGQQLSRLQKCIEPINQLNTRIDSTLELLALAQEEGEQSMLTDIIADIADIPEQLHTLEFQRMFSGDMDDANAFVDIQAGSGGTEAQDWADMLLRMYLRWGERKDFQLELLEKSNGDVAGIKSATIKVDGSYAFGWLRTETGVHRLVRKSPFDSGNRRHTSFASVFVYPEINDDIEIEINPSDLRVDTYRSSGAGGQHVNTTDSAIRITHEPSGIVVQCQNQRSQHQNRDQAMKQLKAKLYEQEMQEKRQKQAELEANKSDIGWGRQIRSYVLDQSRIKDLRTGVESGNTQSILDGNLDGFIEESLKQGV